MTDALLDMALREHQAGNLAEARMLYLRLLAEDPRHCDALHLLGVLAYQGGQFDVALTYIRQAISLKPAAAFFGNLGLVLAAQGEAAQAISAYRQAISLQPQFPEAHNNLGTALKLTGEIDQAIASYQLAVSLRPGFAEAHNNLGLALSACGQVDAAIEAYRHAVKAFPNYAEARNNLGNAWLLKGEHEKAISCWREAISLKSQFPDAYNNLGRALKTLGRVDEAIAALRQALALQPALAEAHNNLGVIFAEQGDAAQAIEAYQNAIAVRPDFADAHFNLAISLRAIGEGTEAIAACRRALALRAGWAEALNNLGIWLLECGQAGESLAMLDEALAGNPAYAQAHLNRGNTLRQMGSIDRAITAYLESARLRPDCAQTQSNLGAAYQQAGRLEEAIAALRSALALDPKLAQAHNNLANALKDCGDLDGAMACYARAVELNPSDAAADSNRVYTLHFHPDFQPRAIRAAHEQWARRHAEPLRGAARGHDNDRAPGRRLRIGYVSPDFREHCQSLFTAPLLAHHDHQKFEIVGYGDVLCPDGVTDRLRACCDAWRNISGMHDGHVADLIRADRIDILVDLTAHMAHNRLLVFARKPAPLQVTWLAYPGTTGLAAMDYRLSDPYLDPPGTDVFYSEKTIRLPRTFWCYDPSSTQPGNELPLLENGWLTFGCLNNFCKINSQTLHLWAQVLSAVPHSRLLLLAPRGPARQRVCDILGQQGIEPTRIRFAERQPRAEYLKLYHQIDVGLDTFPYNGHTTTLDALWMGVPVISRIGQTAVGRGGWSQLSNLGLTEWVAESAAGFVAIAAGLAADVRQLQSLRAGLRQRLMRSPLMDADQFAGDIENAYRAMWEQYVASESLHVKGRPLELSLFTEAAANRHLTRKMAS